MFFDKIYLSYSGGLGNQMFQYAFELQLKKKGKVVQSELSLYNKRIDHNVLILPQVFRNVKMELANSDAIHELRLKYKYLVLLAKAFSQLTYIGLWNREKKEFLYDKSVFLIKRGVLEGYWQCYKYFEDIKEQIYYAFEFTEPSEQSVQNIVSQISNNNAVGIHVRRGDYLKGKNIKKYGNICTLDYYKRAIEYISQSIEKPVFFVFSNDTEWVKENLEINNVVWVDEVLDTNREDWIDMYLMSLCKHNIIANSTFSWWGAWLNKNPEKVVVAPKKWINGLEKEELCPKDWIRL